VAATWPENGLGQRPGHAGRCAQRGGAPAGRGAAPCLALLQAARRRRGAASPCAL